MKKKMEQIIATQKRKFLYLIEVENLKILPLEGVFFIQFFHKI